MIKIYLFVDSFCVCTFYSSGVNFIVYLITSLALTRGSIERTLFLFLLLLSFCHALTLDNNSERLFKVTQYLQRAIFLKLFAKNKWKILRYLNRRGFI